MPAPPRRLRSPWSDSNDASAPISLFLLCLKSGPIFCSVLHLPGQLESRGKGVSGLGPCPTKTAQKVPVSPKQEQKAICSAVAEEKAPCKQVSHTKACSPCSLLRLSSPRTEMCDAIFFQKWIGDGKGGTLTSAGHHWKHPLGNKPGFVPSQCVRPTPHHSHS